MSADLSLVCVLVREREGENVIVDELLLLCTTFFARSNGVSKNLFQFFKSEMQKCGMIKCHIRNMGAFINYSTYMGHCLPLFP